MNKKEFELAIKGIIQHNRDTIPKVTRPKCNDCKNLCLRNRMITCKTYLNGIPDEILDNKIACKEFKQK